VFTFVEERMARVRGGKRGLGHLKIPAARRIFVQSSHLDSFLLSVWKRSARPEFHVGCRD